MSETTSEAYSAYVESHKRRAREQGQQTRAAGSHGTYGPGPCPNCDGPTERHNHPAGLLIWSCVDRCGGYRLWNLENRVLQ